jgi:redox-sensitive bicupin YhaK (pirin superfamily)
MNNRIIHRSNTRGHANHGWLDSRHTFSFAGYYNPERIHFGVLRVLNDDIVAGGMGFGTHPHDNMEIISIPLQGDLIHKDSMGNTQIISEGDVQIMSAGSGITHSEYNKNTDKQVNFLQIWIYPNQKNVSPRYDQQSFKKEDRKNKLQLVISPKEANAGIWIHQDAWFHLGDIEPEKSISYSLKKEGNGIYIFVLVGSIEVDGEILDKRDGIGLWETNTVVIEAKSNAEILIMEVPMKTN